MIRSRRCRRPDRPVARDFETRPPSNAVERWRVFVLCANDETRVWFTSELTTNQPSDSLPAIPFFPPDFPDFPDLKILCGKCSPRTPYHWTKP